MIISSEKMRNLANYIFMVMVTRSSDRIFNPSRYTGPDRYNDKNI